MTPLTRHKPDLLRVDLVYTAASQSQGGAFDQVIHFTTGEDKIDLSFLQLPRFESSHAGNGVDYDTDGNNIVDALEAFGAVRALPSAPVVAANSPFAGLFLDGGVYKPVATQSLNDGNGDPSTTVFIDVDGNGDYNPSADMIVVLGVGAPVSGDFIFNQYGGGWGG